MADARDRAREAAATAALAEIEPGATIALGSGRAVWKVVDAIVERWPDGAGPRVVVASERTDERARAAGLEVVELDGEVEPAVAIDGADEVGPGLSLIKGGGGALLREKIVIAAARRFVVVAETVKRVERLGESFALPVEVARFGWRDTARRLARLLPGGELRTENGSPYETDERHLIVDCPVPAGVDPASLAEQLAALPGVMEHGLFIGMAERAYLGREDGGVEIVEAGG